jgi:chemotaxis protein CheD
MAYPVCRGRVAPTEGTMVTGSNIVIGVSDAKVSGDPDAILVTYSLGSCIGVTLYDPVVRVGGLLHFQLPTSTLDLERARQCPLMYADTGMESLLASMAAMGAQKKRLKVKLAGAAQILDDGAMFNIGRRNHTAIRKYLWQQAMFVDGEDVGGIEPRTLFLAVADGSVTIKSGKKVAAL